MKCWGCHCEGGEVTGEISTHGYCPTCRDERARKLEEKERAEAARFEGAVQLFPDEFADLSLVMAYRLTDGGFCIDVTTFDPGFEDRFRWFYNTEEEARAVYWSWRRGEVEQLTDYFHWKASGWSVVAWHLWRKTCQWSELERLRDGASDEDIVAALRRHGWTWGGGGVRMQARHDDYRGPRNPSLKLTDRDWKTVVGKLEGAAFFRAFRAVHRLPFKPSRVRSREEIHAEIERIEQDEEPDRDELRLLRKELEKAGAEPVAQGVLL